MRVLFPLLVAIVMLSAGEIAWKQDYAQAEAAAAADGKRIFVFMSTHDCQWCKKLETTTFVQPAIAERLNRDYRAVHLDRDRDSYPSTLRAPVVPMCYFLTETGEIIDFTRGYWDVTDFNLILDDVDKRLKKMKEST
jgi:thioredoxin-related protein